MLKRYVRNAHIQLITHIYKQLYALYLLIISRVVRYVDKFVFRRVQIISNE